MDNYLNIITLPKIVTAMGLAQLNIGYSGGQYFMVRNQQIMISHDKHLLTTELLSGWNSSTLIRPKKTRP